MIFVKEYDIEDIPNNVTDNYSFSGDVKYRPICIFRHMGRVRKVGF